MHASLQQSSRTAKSNVATLGHMSYLQARYSPIQFDYLDYSTLRWNEYHRRKADFVQHMEEVLERRLES